MKIDPKKFDEFKAQKFCVIFDKELNPRQSVLEFLEYCHLNGIRWKGGIESARLIETSSFKQAHPLYRIHYIEGVLQYNSHNPSRVDYGALKESALRLPRVDRD